MAGSRRPWPVYGPRLVPLCRCLRGRRPRALRGNSAPRPGCPRPASGPGGERSGAPGSPELAARWAPVSQLGVQAGSPRGLSSLGREPGHCSSSGCRALCGAARAHPPHLRRCSGGLTGPLAFALRRLSVAAPRAAHAAAPARPAQPRRRSIPRVCAAATTAAAATRRGRAGRAGLGCRGPGGRLAAPAPPRSPCPAPYVTLWPRDSARPAKGVGATAGCTVSLAPPPRSPPASRAPSFP